MDMVVLALVRATDQTPEADDVTAGPWGAIMIGALVVAVVILMRSFLKQMRKADQAKDGGRVRRRAGGPGPGTHRRRGPPFSSLRRHAGVTGTLVRCSAPPDPLR